MSYLSCDRVTSTTIIASDSALATTGRRNSASQKQLSSTHVARKTAYATGPAPVASISTIAATCGSATSAPRKRWSGTATFADRRLFRDAAEGGMAARPCPAMVTDERPAHER